MSKPNSENNKVSKRGFLAPQNRGAVLLGSVLLLTTAVAGYAAFSYLEADSEVQVNVGGLDASQVTTDASASSTEAYRGARRNENDERYSQAQSMDGGVAIPFTFDAEIPAGEDGTDISNCNCTIDDQQLMSAIKRLGISGGDASSRDYMRVAKSDVYIATDGQLMGEDGQSLQYNSNPVYMKADGQLFDEKGVSILSKSNEQLYLSNKGGVIDGQARSVPLLGDLLMSSGVILVSDGRMASRPGNMLRSGRSDIYVTTEGQLVTMDGKPIRHSGAFVYQDDERKLINRNIMDVAWEQKSVYQNKSGHLVSSSGEMFDQPGILFSYEGILIDNNGMLTRPLVNIEKVGGSDIYKTKSKMLVDGYGLPITHYGANVRIGPADKLLTAMGQPVQNRNNADVYITDSGVLRADVGKGGVQSGMLKTSDGIALDRHGQMITRRGRLEQRGSSDIYLSSDGFLSTKDGKPVLFMSKDTFIDFSLITTDGSQGLETYDREPVIDSSGNRVYLSFDGRIVDVIGNAITEIGILSSSDGVLISSSGKKIVQDAALERVVTKDGLPVTFNGKDVFKGEDGRLYDVDGNPILTADGRAVFMDENGNIIDEFGSVVDDIALMAGDRAVQNGELSTRKSLTTATGEQILHNGKEVFVDASGRVVDENGNAVLTADGREVYINAAGEIVDENGNKIDEDLLKTESGQSISSGIIAGREQVVTKDGKAVRYNGKDVYRGQDGSLYDADGNVITTKDGKRIFIDADGNMIDEDGNLVTEDLLTVSGEGFVRSGDLVTRKQLTDANGDAVKYGNQDVYIGKDGRLIDEHGNAIKTKDGRDVFVGSDGKMRDKDGNVITEDLLSVKAEGAFDNEIEMRVSQVKSADGKGVQFNGKDVFVDNEGRLYDENGEVIRSADGREVFMDAQGNLVDENGNLITENLLTDSSGKSVSSGLKGDADQIIKAKVNQVKSADGKAVLFKGKAVFTDSDGRLLDENGNAIRTADGREVFMDAQGNLVDENGNRITEDLLTDSSGKSVSAGLKNGAATTIDTRVSQVKSADGKDILFNGKEVFTDSEGRLYDENGEVIRTADGREVFMDAQGNLVDENGNRITEALLTDSSGKSVSSGLTKDSEKKIKIKVNQVKSADGKAVLFKGKEVFTDSDGRLLDENGNAIRTADGREVFMDAQGNLVDENGNRITESLLTDSSGKSVSSGLKKGAEATIDTWVSQVKSADGKDILFNGKEVFADSQGRLYDENGEVIRTADGREVFMDAQGNLVDEKGNRITEDLLTDSSGKSVSSGLAKKSEKKSILIGGVKSIKQLTAKDGSALTVDGKNVFVDEYGRVVDENGKVITTDDGREIFVDKNGNLVDKNGDIIDEAILEKVEHRDLKAGEITSLRQMTDANGNAVFHDGKAVFTDAEGRLVDENGNVIKTADGRDVFVDAQGNLVDGNGVLIEEDLLKNISGEVVKGGLKKGREKLITKSGDSIKYKGGDVFKAEDGSLLDANGNQIFTADGKKVFVNAAGEMVDEHGNLVTDDAFSVEERSFVSGGITLGNEKLITKDGKVLTFEGKNVFKAEDGSLVDALGNPILSVDGKRIFVDEDGRLVDEDGVLIDDSRFETVKEVAAVSGLKAGLEQIMTKDGGTVKYQGKKVYKSNDGSLVDEDGNEILTADGRKVYMNEDGQIVDIDGNIITEDLLTANNKPVQLGQLTSAPISDMKRVGSSEIFVSRDGTLLDENGRAITFNGKKVRVGENGQLFDENGRAIVDKFGKSVFINAKGELVDHSGAKIDDSILTNGDGVLLNSDGSTVKSSIIKVGDSDIYKTADGRLVDKDGKAIKFNGENVYVGDDGRMYYKNGRPVTDANGNSVYLDPDTGVLVDRDGVQVKGSVLTNSDGVLIDSSGELITTGGKLKRIAGTDFYQTEDGQVVDSEGKPIIMNGIPSFIDENGRITNQYGSAIRFNGQELYISDDGDLVDSNGRPVLDKEGSALRLSAEGGLVNEDGVSPNKIVTKPTKKASFSRPPVIPKQPAAAVSSIRNDPSADVNVKNVAPLVGKKPVAVNSSPVSEKVRPLTPQEAARLQRRYLLIKNGVRNQVNDAKQVAHRNVSPGFITIGGTADSGLPVNNAEGGPDAGSDGGDTSKESVVYQKAGTMLYAVTSYQINSDFVKTVVVDLVGLPPRHPLYNAKAMGTFELAYDRMVMTFDKVCPVNSECVPMNGVALDPGTSAAALASGVDKHYWYRYGGLFLASMLEGTSIAMGEAGTREESTSNTGTKVTTTGLDGDKLMLRSLGTVGERFSEVFASQMSRPVTAWLNPGSELAIMLFDDVKGSPE